MQTTSNLSNQSVRLQVGSDEITLRVTSEATGGTLLVADVALPAGGGPPGLHRHAPEEVYRVQCGELTHLRGGRPRVTCSASRPGPGPWSTSPAGAPTPSATSPAPSALAHVVFSPGAEMEQFVRSASALAAGGEPGFEDVLALAERHGIEMAGPLPG